MKAIGLDVGHSAVKLAYSRGALPETALIPTAVVPAFTIYDDGAAKRAARETVQVGGRSYFVGETAIAQGGMRTTPGLFEDWVQTSQHDALLLAGQRLAIESGADEEALIVLGLPAGLYARQRDALRERASRLLGTEVMVMSQPFGPFSLHMIDERGVLRSAHALESESWAVIEVGYYTTDFTLLRNGLWIEDKTASCSGVSRATDRLRKALSVSGVSSTLMECEEILRTRKMRNFGEMVGVDREVDDALGPMISEILDTADTLFAADARGLDGIIVTGGGSDYVVEAIQSRWQRVVKPANPRFSVAEGMRRQGEYKLRMREPQVA
ncbi:MULTISPECIES: ParM/StbA family protein [Ralstonia]|uniref:ParM/StbA family protein n=1 Tax=Ralstonia TaxID=48736 RepID=UPI00040C1716|nr:MULTISPECIES: ParM/StbA family protein [Ralstonia]MBX3819614.1 ParM/StbA family protein [Ralstonia insidiosa]NOZ17932.1 ParM/StbA family protein [Betaproteobacteria bacterium]MBT2179660.1 ParM/StbA family protein [Ralstonia pickettii]MBX3774773.1 ParM/StbA family protein [Ralstonia pickettii]MBX3813730.1 ParM/StbA family protein [Ralstonia pickettii]